MSDQQNINPYPTMNNDQYQNPPAYQPPMQVHQAHLENQNPTLLVISPLKQPLMLPSNLNDVDGEVDFRCPLCQQESVSSCQYRYGSCTYLCALFLCIFGVIPGILPLCISGCQNRYQTCRNCGAQVGFKEYNPCC